MVTQSQTSRVNNVTVNHKLFSIIYKKHAKVIDPIGNIILCHYNHKQFDILISTNQGLQIICFIIGVEGLLG